MHEAVLDREMRNPGHRLGRFGRGQLQAPKELIGHHGTWIANRIGRSGITRRRRPPRGHRHATLVPSLHVVTRPGRLLGVAESSSSPDGRPIPHRRGSIHGGRAGLARLGVRGHVPAYRGNAARTGMMPGPGPIDDARVAWKLTADGPIYSAPVVAGGMVYVAAGSGSLYAIDLATGRQRWLAHASTSKLSTPDVVGGAVLVGTADGLQAFDSTTGEQRGPSAPMASGRAHADADGIVAVATGAGTVVAVDATTGAVRWKADAGAPVESSLAIEAASSWWGPTTDRSWHSRSLDGQSSGRRTLVTRVGSAPLRSREVASSPAPASTRRPPSHHIVALDAASGLILWRYASPTGAAVYTPAVERGTSVRDERRRFGGRPRRSRRAWSSGRRRSMAPSRSLPRSPGRPSTRRATAARHSPSMRPPGGSCGGVRIKGIPSGPTVAGGLLLIGTNVGELAAIGGTLP